MPLWFRSRSINSVISVTRIQYNKIQCSCCLLTLEPIPILAVGTICDAVPFLRKPSFGDPPSRLSKTLHLPLVMTATPPLQWREEEQEIQQEASAEGGGSGAIVPSLVRAGRVKGAAGQTRGAIRPSARHQEGRLTARMGEGTGWAQGGMGPPVGMRGEGTVVVVRAAVLGCRVTGYGRAIFRLRWAALPRRRSRRRRHSSSCCVREVIDGLCCACIRFVRVCLV